MHLLDLLAARTEPAAAVLLTLTRRCPLACAHCSTASTMGSEQIDAAVLKRFVGTFTAADRPEYVLLTGGEPLLRPRLVREIAERVREAGGRTHLLSGMFFAAHGRMPGPVRRAIDAVDHFAASLDAFHEREVPRAAVLRVLRRLLDEGKDLSVQLTGLTPGDPYLRQAAEEIRGELADRVPVLVTVVRGAGRARTWLPGPAPDPVTEGLGHRSVPAPCAMAAWPVVCFDGTVVGCCNQDVVDAAGLGRLPDHLRLGHIARDDWATLRERQLNRPLLRGIRAFGPRHLASLAGVGCEGYCAACVGVLGEPGVAARVGAVLERPGVRAVERRLGDVVREGGGEAFLWRHGVEGYRELAALGHEAGAS